MSQQYGSYASPCLARIRGQHSPCFCHVQRKRQNNTSVVRGWAATQPCARQAHFIPVTKFRTFSLLSSSLFPVDPMLTRSCHRLFDRARTSLQLTPRRHQIQPSQLPIQSGFSARHVLHSFELREPYSDRLRTNIGRYSRLPQSPIVHCRGPTRLL